MFDHFEKDFFEGARVLHVEFDLLADQWEALKSEFSRNEWTDEEGLRCLLATGLQAVQNESLLDALSTGELNTLGELKRLQSNQLELNGQYAVMKFRAFQFMQAAKVLEWQLNAARTEIEGLNQMIAQLRNKLETQSP